MEFPDSKQFGMSTKSFIDNERGDTVEISNKEEIKNFKPNVSDKKNIGDDGDEILIKTNLNGNAVDQKDNVTGKNEQNDQKINSHSVLNKEQEKFNQCYSLNSKETFSNEDEKFKGTVDNTKTFETFKASEIDSENQGNSVEGVANPNDPTSIGTCDPKPGTSESNEEEKSEKEEWMDILGSGQLKKKTLKPGIPDSRPQKADVCEISLTGKLENGTIFEQQQCLEVNLGDNETVQGLDFALALMDKGEEAEVIVASRFGYGSLGYKPHVPPDATLHYHIILHDVKQEPLINLLSMEERTAIGNRKKERGNWWYTRDEHTLAIHSYRRALDYLDDTDILGDYSEQQMQHLIEVRLKTYNNLGASQMKISAYDAALISIDHVLNCQPKNVKALFRKSKILKEKGELSKSIEVIRQALAIEPDSKGFQQELSLLLAAQRKDNSKQRDLYKKMMGNSLQESESDKKKKTSSNTFKWIAAVSFAVAVIGALAFKYKL